MADNKPIQPPTGTRDLYPVEAARRRFITEAWRRASINHGFEEVDGPTFESTELYTKKSGDGIVSEIFGVFSGKDEQGVKALGEKLARGEDAPAPYALRPEFTPTLARMYAARAASLPKPTKWFTAGPFFRAERPQRGRLREFLQWNCDVIGPSADGDYEVIDVCRQLLVALGLGLGDFQIRVNDRRLVQSLVERAGIPAEKHSFFYSFLDGRAKRSQETNADVLADAGIDATSVAKFDAEASDTQDQYNTGKLSFEGAGGSTDAMWSLAQLVQRLNHGGQPWCRVDMSIVRGLAYYTGMVFEVIVDGERAVAGGGRYDNLIELFGGPSTPAVGFGMGDVVLSLVLQDKGKFPKDVELSRITGQSPDVFVMSAAGPQAETAMLDVVDELRAVKARVPGEPAFKNSLKVRRTYKQTKNLGKLMEEAEKSGAFLVVVVDSQSEARIKQMGIQDATFETVPIASLKVEVLKRLGRAGE